ncbi:hypothetical protein SDJN02_16847 [Cucurbita argyrosperma subsp. argyrosperma]|nr:hypothetical protein SDJN02_16847 [Cucurbita argyrosperma subsp. argyrosperma]
MGRSCHGDETWEEQNQIQEQEDEEALSFCDLPLKETQPPLNLNETPIRSSAAVQSEDFDFNHCPPPLPQPMCAADEVFFQGHILPLRHSFSSENSHNNPFFPRNSSTRSESSDMLRFRNGSTSSSSSRSHYSRSSSISNNSISIPTNSKPRSHNNVFHSHPSPTPQIRSHSTSGRRSRSSSRWDFFRLGLLRTPGMELHDLKTRTNSASAAATPAAHTTAGSFLGVVSCKKSVDTVAAAGKKKRSENGKEKEKEKEKERETRVSHRRTFEWVKQLSHASSGDEQ